MRCGNNLSGALLLAAMIAGCAGQRASTDGQPAPISREAATRKLVALGSEIEYADELLSDGSDGLRRVRAVWFPTGACNDEVLRYVAAFPELEHLELFGQPVTDDGLRHLSKLAHLQWLGLCETQVTARLAAGDTIDALCEAIALAGEKLGPVLPRQSDDVNELADALVVIEAW